jgi:hypothetical protein
MITIRRIRPGSAGTKRQSPEGTVTTGSGGGGSGTLVVVAESPE